MCEGYKYVRCEWAFIERLEVLTMSPLRSQKFSVKGASHHKHTPKEVTCFLPIKLDYLSA